MRESVFLWVAGFSWYDLGKCCLFCGLSLDRRADSGASLNRRRQWSKFQREAKMKAEIKACLWFQTYLRLNYVPSFGWKDMVKCSFGAQITSSWVLLMTILSDILAKCLSKCNPRASISIFIRRLSENADSQAPTHSDYNLEVKTSLLAFNNPSSILMFENH